MNLSFVAELPTAGSNLNHRVKVKDLERILIGDLNLNRGPGSKLPNPANKLIRFFQGMYINIIYISRVIDFGLFGEISKLPTRGP